MMALPISSHKGEFESFSHHSYSASERKGTCQTRQTCGPGYITLACQVLQQTGEVRSPLLSGRRKRVRNHQLHHGIFLFLFGILLSGRFKALFGEALRYYTSAQDRPCKPCRSIPKEKPHFLGVIATAFGNVQVCCCGLEIFSHMHI